MPYHRFDWHERVKAVENEYKSVRIAVDRLKSAVALDPTVLGADPKPANLGVADRNLEGTYLVRLFAEFESALRSYDRARHDDPTRKTDASILIDMIGGRRGQGISAHVRQAHTPCAGFATTGRTNAMRLLIPYRSRRRVPVSRRFCPGYLMSGIERSSGTRPRNQWVGSAMLPFEPHDRARRGQTDHFVAPAGDRVRLPASYGPPGVARSRRSGQAGRPADSRAGRRTAGRHRRPRQPPARRRYLPADGRSRSPGGPLP